MPQAADDAASIAEDTIATVPVKTNDSDADGDTLTIQSVTQGLNGSVSISGNNVLYAPAANWFTVRRS